MDCSRSLPGFALLALLSCGAAHAQQQISPADSRVLSAPPQTASQPPQVRLASPSPDAPDFMELAKGKGYITRADIPKNEPTLDQLRLHFNEADTDHNGRVDEREYGVYLIKMNSGRR